MNKNTLAFGIILLFIFTFITPLADGNDVEIIGVDIKLDEIIERLRFACTTPEGLSEEKYEYYKEQLIKQYLSETPNDDIVVESLEEGLFLPVEPLSSPISSNGPMDSAWPIAYHDSSHTSRSPYSTVNNSYDEKWRFYNNGWIQDTPIIDDDETIYFGGNYNGLPWYVFAIDSDGMEKWKFMTDGLIWGSSPAISDDGIIYVGSWDGGLYAINPDGTQKWRFGTGAQIASSPVIADDGTIYFGCMGPGDDGRIYAVYSNGSEKWHYDTGYWIVSDPCIGDDGTIYIGSGDTYFYAMDFNGTLKWRFKTGDWIQGHPSIAIDGTIYIGSFDGYTYAIDPNGTEKWRYGVSTETNPSIASDGTIYIGSEKLYAINSDGTNKWSFDLGSDSRIVSSSPAIASEGTIYFGTNIGEKSGGDIIAVNPDGTERWRKRIADNWVDSSPSIAEDGTVYIGCAYDIDNGYLYAFGSQESNDPPLAPSITGQTSGKIRTEYTYTFVATDPDNNPISYYVDWGDNTQTDWTREYASGEIVEIKHTWNEQGTYSIRSKAKDSFGEEGPWGKLDVRMPIAQNLESYLLLQVLGKIFSWFLNLSLLLKCVLSPNI